MGPVTFRFEDLVKIKKKGVPQALLETLRAEADRIITEPTLCVTKQKITAPSEDPHDYISVGIYWWPNPDAPDGLPYVRRDGVRNHDTQDRNLFRYLPPRIQTLALAAFYLEDPVYAEYAQRQLYDWFLNPETRMNPNGKFAQAVPGISEGRCYGLIDFANAYLMFDGIGILERLGLLEAEFSDAIRAWYRSFTDWMLTHENGLEEDNTRNNHGVWYDAQILAAAVFTGRPQLAKKICTTAYDRRVKTQIMPDGSQPKELARTQGMNYSLYNLRAFSVIAAIAERLGYDRYWQKDPESGVCLLKQAVDYLHPYVIAPATFPYQELEPESAAAKMAEMLLQAAARYPDAGYAEKAAALMDDTMLWRLIPIKNGGNTMKRTFSSLACMEASFPELLDYAKGAGYDALEIRLDKQDNICGTSKDALPLILMQEKGVKILDLGTGVGLQDYTPEKIERAKSNADLAAFVGAKAIRLFVGGGIKTIHDVSNHNLEGIVRAVKEISDYAKTVGVEVWLETHSYFSTGETMKQILDGVQDENVKVIWDVIHSVEFGETPEKTMEYIGDSIAHVHIKDGKKSPDPERIAWDLTAHGSGTLPIVQVLQLLKDAGYEGYLSLEWESAWHPELNAHYPDIPTLLAAYNRYLDEAQ